MMYSFGVCFVVRYRSSMVSRFGVLLRLSCGVLLRGKVSEFDGVSFRSSASVLMRSSAPVLISIRGLVSEFMLSVFICGIKGVLLTFIVHVSSVVVAACWAPLEVDNPLV